MSALLLYGVARADKTLALPENAGADGVLIIAQGKVAAIAGAVPFKSARELTRRAAVSHLFSQQRTLETIMAQGAVLPVRFGRMAPSETAARRMLTLGEARLAAKLEEFADSIQMEVSVSWDLERVFSEIARETHIVRASGTPVGGAGAPDACADEETRIRVGAMVKASLDRRRRDVAGRLMEELMTVAADAVENPLSGDAEVANFALLLDKADVGSLEGVLNRLDADFGGRLDFRCVGPAPLSTFAAVDVDFSLALAAREAWRTGRPASAADLERAPDFDAFAANLEQDVFIHVTRRAPVLFGPPAPVWRSEEARP
jgi:hypothetical protein